MAWAKAGTTTLSCTTDVIDVTSLSNNKFSTMLNHGLYSGDSNGTFNFNNDTGSNYAFRNNYAGGSEGTSVNQTKFSYNDSSTHDSIFAISYIVNISSEEKLFITNQATVGSTGAGNAPNRAEQVGKWANTSDVITSIKHTQSSGGGDYVSGSNVAVIGSDGVESMKVQYGAIYYETDTNKEYILNNGSWSEL